MCGIAGFSAPGGAAQSQGLVEEILASQWSRGPDCTATAQASGNRLSAIIGNNRLSIIDLSAAANQPMWNADRDRCLTYNGEIYNYLELRKELQDRGHRFRTASDSEVLLAAFERWGAEAIRRFNGFFALAIFDVKADEMILARDRFGVKPLYYIFRSDHLAFASTPTVLAKRYALAPDLIYVAAGLRYGVFNDSTAAPYEGMSVVPPGTTVHVMVGEDGKLVTQQRRYYDLASRVEGLIDSLGSQGPQAQADQVASLLEDAVRLRLRSDVPMAVSLSGGLDSTSIAAIAHSQSRGRVKGFCFGDPDDASTEGPKVASFATEIGMEMEFVRPSMPEIVGSLSRTLDAQGAPFASASVIAQYLLYQAVKEDGVRVLLGGQGADEAFMGYRKFYPFYLMELVSDRHLGKAMRFLVPAARMLLAEMSQAGTYLAELHRYRSAPERSALELPELPAPNLRLTDGEPLWRRQVRDVTALSLPALLRYEDRNSMAHSVESRLPFLDYRLLELAIALPTASKLRAGYGKWILREAMSKRVPSFVRSTRLKRGFDVCQQSWIDLGLGSEIRQQLEAHSGHVKDRLVPGLRIRNVFSNSRLKRNPRAFAEAIALLWLVRLP